MSVGLLKTCRFLSFTSPNHAYCTPFSFALPSSAAQAPHRSLFCMGLPHSDPNERAYFWLLSSEAISTHELLDSLPKRNPCTSSRARLCAYAWRDEFCDDEPGRPKGTEGVLFYRQVQARRLRYIEAVSSQTSSTRGQYVNTTPVVFDCRAGPRANSMVEGV